MKIGIIGAGNIGGTIARTLSAADHVVKLAGSKGPEAISDLAQEIGAEAVAAKNAVNDVDAIVLSIPFIAIPNLASLFADVPRDVVVIDTSNYYPQRDGQIDEVEDGKPESVWASEQLGRPIVKAFNAILAQTLQGYGMPPGSAGRIAIPVAGDDQSAKTLAQQIVDATGFDPLDAGGLAASWRFQPGTAAYCTGLSLPELQQALAVADRIRAPQNRDSLIGEFMALDKPLTHEFGIARNRAVTAS